MANEIIPKDRQTATDRLIGSVKWGIIGSGVGAGLGVLGGRYAQSGKFGKDLAKYAHKKLPLIPAGPAVTHAITGAGAGSKAGSAIGLLIGRRHKDKKELNAMIDDLIEMGLKPVTPTKIKAINLNLNDTHMVKTREGWKLKPNKKIVASKLSEKLDDLIEFKIPPIKGVKPGSIGKSPLGLAVRKNKITKRLKLKKDVQGSIPGDAGGCAVLSSKLDELIRFSQLLDKHGLVQTIVDHKTSRYFGVKFNDPRPRNNLGEFSPQQEGVADPNSMAKTYQLPPRPGGLGGGAGLALAGGAVGAIGGAAGKDVYNSGMSALKNLLNKKRPRR